MDAELSQGAVGGWLGRGPGVGGGGGGSSLNHTHFLVFNDNPATVHCVGIAIIQLL